jgi:hypothetical protein
MPASGNIQDGFCQLCAEWKSLRHSHVYPAFAYKRFVSDLTAGGSFADLAELRRHNRQFKHYWFCNNCESRFGETETAAWLEAIPSAAPSATYGPHLFTYAVSVMLRCALRERQDGTVSQQYKSALSAPIKVWREYLLGKRKGVGVHTVHGFLAGQDENDAAWPTGLGGQVAYAEDLVITRTGPLVVFGLLAKTNLSVTEAKRWSATEISPSGGNILVVRKSDNYAGITLQMANTLNITEQWCINQAGKMT